MQIRMNYNSPNFGKFVVIPENVQQILSKNLDICECQRFDSLVNGQNKNEKIGINLYTLKSGSNRLSADIYCTNFKESRHMPLQEETQGLFQTHIAFIEKICRIADAKKSELEQSASK